MWHCRPTTLQVPFVCLQHGHTADQEVMTDHHWIHEVRSIGRLRDWSHLRLFDHWQVFLFGTKTFIEIRLKSSCLQQQMFLFSESNDWFLGLQKMHEKENSSWHILLMFIHLNTNILINVWTVVFSFNRQDFKNRWNIYFVLVNVSFFFCQRST